MRILYLSNSRIPSRTANSVHVMKMAQAFIQEGHETLLVAQEPPDRVELTLEQLKDHYGLSVDVPLSRLFVRSRLAEYEVALHSAILARRWRPDFVLTRDIPTAAATVALGIPTWYEQHNPDVGPIKRLLLRWLLRQSTALGMIVISYALKNEVLKRWGDVLTSERVVVLPDGVDLERFTYNGAPSEARAELGLQEAFTVGYAGHLYQGRGIELILDLAEMLPDIQFLIVGGNEQDVEHYRNISNSRGIRNLLLVGFVTNNVLPRYLAASDILLAPYQQSVQVSGGGDTAKWMSPMKIFEYLAVGRPIITSDLPVLHEVLNKGNTVFCSPENHKDWVLAIRSIHESVFVQKNMSRSARLAAVNYSWRGRVSRLVDITNSSTI